MNDVAKTAENSRIIGRPFPKGVSGNPNGRPKGVSIVDAIKRELENKPEGSDRTYLELLIQRIFKSAIQDGDVHMIKDIINRTDGMPQGSAPQVAVQVNNYQATPEQEALLDEWVVKRYKELEAEGKV
jgi:hypothetical protein